MSFELTSTSLDFVDVGYEFLALVHMHLLLVWIELVNTQIFSVLGSILRDPNFDVLIMFLVMNRSAYRAG